MTQDKAIEMMLDGKSLFLTGEPGAGKTYTLTKFIKHSRDLGKRLAITASTGIAASHIDGITVHSWSGLGIKTSIKDHELDTMSYKPYIADKYRRCDILIIDEISMLPGYYLDMIDRAARMIRRNDKPFGGLQVILVGDLFQLPPVSQNDDPSFSHESEAWKSLDLEVAYLTEQHRQGADDKLLGLLQSMREGDFSDDEIQTLETRVGQSPPEEITRLYTHNKDVDQMNHQKLEALGTPIKSYRMTESGDGYRVKAMKRGILAPDILYLAVGAEVMFVANNWEEGFVNGTRGRITGFDGNVPLVVTDDGKKIHVVEHSWKSYDEQGQVVIAEVKQYPLRLAWAVTVHKSQGMSLDSAEVDLSKAFTPGMGYVALSRVRSLDGLFLVGLGVRRSEWTKTSESSIKN